MKNFEQFMEGMPSHVGKPSDVSPSGPQKWQDTQQDINLKAAMNRKMTGGKMDEKSAKALHQFKTGKRRPNIGTARPFRKLGPAKPGAKGYKRPQKSSGMAKPRPAKPRKR